MLQKITRKLLVTTIQHIIFCLMYLFVVGDLDFCFARMLVECFERVQVLVLQMWLVECSLVVRRVERHCIASLLSQHQHGVRIQHLPFLLKLKNDTIKLVKITNVFVSIKLIGEQVLCKSPE